MQITDGIILRKEELGEADLLITALTERFVRIRLVAQSARKVEAKLKGHLEPLSMSRLSFVAGRNQYRLVGAELLDFFSVIKGDPGRLTTAAEILRAVDSALFEDQREENKNFFALTLSALAQLNNSSLASAELEALLIWFRVRFLDELGLFPDGDAIRGVSPSDFVKRAPASVDQFAADASRLFGEYLPR